MIGWKHVGEKRWTESLVLWSVRTAPVFLLILHMPGDESPSTPGLQIDIGHDPNSVSL